MLNGYNNQAVYKCPPGFYDLHQSNSMSHFFVTVVRIHVYEIIITE